MKKFDLSNLAIDVESGISGVWHDLGDGLKLKVARANNPKYIRLFNELIGPYRRMIQAGALPDDKQAGITAEAVSKTILLDWEGMHIDGVATPYSQVRAKEILEQPKYATFFTLVMTLAQDEAAYRERGLQTDLGEQPTVSDGGSNGASMNEHYGMQSDDSE